MRLGGLRRLAEHAEPAFTALETGGRGLTTSAGFFGGQITARCAGPLVPLGSWPRISGRHAPSGMYLPSSTSERGTRNGLRWTRPDLGQLRPEIDLDATAERSRAGSAGR
ncbi:hypothetical protein [Amycolatopsis alkalitolerans]|uniref:Uncharacterized protein n=1 Tax=Amycolatopsis alkalitolerans TaxID=2547244 RepID=A0A5C4M206_9PSEU|nr:hypothetical protein [Amycolatopsis alkalitolerans]TNC23787.1 hypothetical protein FG385_20765 [Amycolatopsis alkalitolerans]